MAERRDELSYLEAQKIEISTLLKKNLVKGDTWYLIDTKWFKQWKRYVGYESWDTGGTGDQANHPGPLDTSPLLKEGEGGTDIRDHLIDELDYVLIPDDAWRLMSMWYGQAPGMVPIPKKVVEYGVFIKHCKVEVYLVEFKLCLNFDLDKDVSRKFSKVDTIATLESVIRQVYNVAEDVEARLWSRYTANTYEALVKPYCTVQDAGLFQGQIIVLETKSEQGHWPRKTRSSASSSMTFGPSGSMVTLPERTCTQTSATATATVSMHHSPTPSCSTSFTDTLQPGVCGLSNLGNTCFMNSVLQCMSNCPPICMYFLNDEHYKELNEENPLGMKGEIAKAFGELIKIMWSGRYSYTVPRAFKMQVSRFAPQFCGYQQHDSQELLTFLLDGLHEDLNRIKVKPYIEYPDGSGRPEEEVAQESWDQYQQRNSSIIVDVFHGLLKSTVVCPVCPKVSVTFDPVCYLSLPLPIKRERQIEVILVPFDPLKKPTKYKVAAPKGGRISDLRVNLSKLCWLPPDCLLVTDVYSHRFHKIYTDKDLLDLIDDKDDIYVYEIPSLISNTETVLVVAYLQEKSSDTLFGTPLIVPVSQDGCTYTELYQKALQRMVRYVKLPDDNSDFCGYNNPESIVRTDVELSNQEVGANIMDDNGKEKEENISEVTSGTDNQGRSFQLFQIKRAIGNSEEEPLNDDGNLITFSKTIGQQYLILDWFPGALSNCYDRHIAKEFESHESLRSRPSQRIALSSCLELYTTTEKLGADDAWYCPSCKKHHQATKKFDLWLLPQILIVQLKRFSYNRYRRDKLDVVVDFPVKGLDMTPYIKNKKHGQAVYDLIGVINHFGSMGAGHYTAYAVNKDDGNWYCFDDSCVTQTTQSSVVSRSAYVLFYMRRDKPSPAPPRTIPCTQVSGVKSSSEEETY